jgi:hypothetical protein
MPTRGYVLRIFSYSAVTLSLIAISFSHSRSHASQTDATPASTGDAASLRGPSFVPDGRFHGPALDGWHTLGKADWRADQGEIIGRATGDGAGWLVMDHSFQDTGLYTSFQCVGPCDTGVLLRLHQVAEGMQGIYLAIREGELKAYNLTLDSDGKEVARKELRAAGGQIRFAPPPPDPCASGPLSNATQRPVRSDHPNHPTDPGNPPGRVERD